MKEPLHFVEDVKPEDLIKTFELMQSLGIGNSQKPEGGSADELATFMAQLVMKSETSAENKERSEQILHSLCRASMEMHEAIEGRLRPAICLAIVAVGAGFSLGVRTAQRLQDEAVAAELSAPFAETK